MKPWQFDLVSLAGWINRQQQEETLDRMIFFSEASLRKAVAQFLKHFHGERNHQGLENRLIDAGVEVG